jgi:hypothetical protein
MNVGVPLFLGQLRGFKNLEGYDGLVIHLGWSTQNIYTEFLLRALSE